MAGECDVLISNTLDQDFYMIDDAAPLLGTNQYGVCWNGGQPYRNGRFYPFRANIVGRITSSTDASGNVSVTLSNLRIVPSGTTDSYWSTNRHAAPWYGSTSSAVPAYRAISIAVVTSQQVPAESSSAWHKCLGGWYAAGVTCGSGCTTDKWGNAPGGTWGYWNDRSGSGSSFSQTQYQSFARNVEDQTWNLGQIAPTDGNTSKIWVIAHWQQGVGYNLNCNIPFSGRSYAAGMSFDVPVLQLCKPEISTVEQQEYLCDNCVNATLCFGASDLGGQNSVNLIVEYKYSGQGWDKALTSSVTALRGEEACITLTCLEGSKTVEWRAKYQLTSGYTAESEWASGSFETLFVPPVDMTVPDINEVECTSITQGKYIEHFSSEVSYYG